MAHRGRLIITLSTLRRRPSYVVSPDTPLINIPSFAVQNLFQPECKGRLRRSGCRPRARIVIMIVLHGVLAV
ncbi:hypothetical protein [Desulfonatronum parangueonense]